MVRPLRWRGVRSRVPGVGMLLCGVDVCFADVTGRARPSDRNLDGCGGVEGDHGAGGRRAQDPADRRRRDQLDGRAAAVGRGGSRIHVLPSIAVAEDVARGRLTGAPLMDAGLRRRLLMALPGTRRLGHAVRGVAELLVDEMRRSVESGAWPSATWLAETRSGSPRVMPGLDRSVLVACRLLTCRRVIGRSENSIRQQATSVRMIVAEGRARPPRPISPPALTIKGVPPCSRFVD